MSAPASELILPKPEKRAGVWAFAVLFLLESLTRAFNYGILSIQANDILHSAQKISVLATVTSATVLVVTLLLPILFGRLRRRYIYSIGCLLLIAGSLALATFTLPGQISGVMLRNIGASITSVTLQLYILDNIRKSDLTTSEPLRLAFSTVAWVLGPWSGGWLYQNYGPIAPQAAAIGSALILLAVFWYLRLKDHSVLPPGDLQPFNPIANVGRFMAQPRLRLAWAIAFVRSAFWGGFFTYGPLMVLEAGLDKSAGYTLVSASQFFLLTSFIFGWLCKRKGLRYVITGCYSVIALGCLSAGVLGAAHIYAAAGFMLLGSWAASGIDSVGGIPYLRAVRFHDRQRMTAVYRTFLETSELLPSAIYSIVLIFFGLQSVFIVLALMAIALAFLTWRFLPKSM